MDDDRRAILARRAAFLAAAVAGAGLGASCAAEQKPQACLEPPAARTEIIVPEPDGSVEEETADAELPGRSPLPEAAPPKPRETYPRICLSEY